MSQSLKLPDSPWHWGRVVGGLAGGVGVLLAAQSVAPAGLPRVVVTGLALLASALVLPLFMDRVTDTWKRVCFGASSVLIVSTVVYIALQPPDRSTAPEAQSVPPAPTIRCGALSDGRSVNGTWGPGRKTFTMDLPATYPVMNSITDNPQAGDERQFLIVKQKANGEDGGWCSSARVQDGDVLWFRVYVENSGAVIVGLPRDHNAARDVTVSVAIDDQPSTLRTLTAYIRASNTTPKVVWCNLDLASPKPFRLDLISGSTRVYSNAKRDHGEEGREVHDLFSKPLRIGFNTDDGVMLPEMKYAMYVYFEMRVSVVG